MCLMFDFRIPFDWKNPIGFLMTAIILYAICQYTLAYAAFMACYGIRLNFYIVSLTEDIESHLNEMNNGIRNGADRSEISDQISEYIQLHSDAKQLSAFEIITISLASSWSWPMDFSHLSFQNYWIFCETISTNVSGCNFMELANHVWSHADDTNRNSWVLNVLKLIDFCNSLMRGIKSICKCPVKQRKWYCDADWAGIWSVLLILYCVHNVRAWWTNDQCIRWNWCYGQPIGLVSVPLWNTENNAHHYRQFTKAD